MPQGNSLAYLPPEVQAQLLGNPALSSGPHGAGMGMLATLLGGLGQEPAAPPQQRKQPRRFTQQEIDKQFSGYGLDELAELEPLIKSGQLPPEYDLQHVRNSFLRRKQQLGRQRP